MHLFIIEKEKAFLHLLNGTNCNVQEFLNDNNMD